MYERRASLTTAECPVVVIGGGPAGLAAALAVHEAGERVVVIERDSQLGGILNQCIHSGFGLHTFGEELTGPEYAERYAMRVEEFGIECLLDTMVVDISPSRVVTAVSARRGVFQIAAEAVILAMGCRERPRGALAIPGDRPAGIFTAGTAQRLVNVEGQLVGREVVILGSGDIGLIMARRLTLEGAHVACVAELMPYSSGLRRNIVQCLDDFGIPLLFSHTVVRIDGRKRVEAVWLAEVGDDLKPLPGTERRYPCDTLLLSVGLLPENELSRAAGIALSSVTHGATVDESYQTSVEGIFACGNVLHVHDLVDYVSEEAAAAGRAAARFVAVRRERDMASGTAIPVIAGAGVRYVVPFQVDPTRLDGPLVLRFRVDSVYRDRRVVVRLGDEIIARRRHRVLAPGEMETMAIDGAALAAHPDVERIVVGLEEV